MIIFLYGQDVYRLHQKLKELIDNFKRKHKKHSYIKHIDVKKSDFESFKDELQTSSIFKEKKLITITNVFSNPIFLKKILEFLRENRKDGGNTLVFWEEKMPNTDNPLLKILTNKGKVYRFEPLSGTKLKEWISREFAKYKVETDPRVIEVLCRFGGNDLWLLSGEIKKLATFVGQTNKIHLNDLELLSKQRVEIDIFSTIDAISSNNKDKALELIHKHLEEGDSPLYLFSMLKKQISNLLIVKNLKEKKAPVSFIIRDSGLHPFVARKCSRLSDKFTFNYLKKIYWKIFQFEIKIKTGKIDPALALELLTIEI